MGGPRPTVSAGTGAGGISAPGGMADWAVLELASMAATWPAGAGSSLSPPGSAGEGAPPSPTPAMAETEDGSAGAGPDTPPSLDAPEAATVTAGEAGFGPRQEPGREGQAEADEGGGPSARALAEAERYVRRMREGALREQGRPEAAAEPGAAAGAGAGA